MTRSCERTIPSAPRSCAARPEPSRSRPSITTSAPPPASPASCASPAASRCRGRLTWCTGTTSAPQRLRDLARPPTLNDTYRTALAEGEALLDAEAVEQATGDGRFAIVNVWRNIAREPVATRPLALCDAASVRPGELVVFEIHYRDRVGENYFAKHDSRHRWVFWSAMTRDEALLIKQWDSGGEMARSRGARADADGEDQPCTFSFHSAFEDPATPPDAPDRWSIEVRCAALFG